MSVPTQYGAGASGGSRDERAIERYRYLLRAAPPDDLERAHREAFEALDVEQRAQVLRQLAAAVPDAERPRSDAPADLARAATRAELRQPGTLDRLFTRDDGSLRIGRLLAANIAGSMAGGFLLSSLFHGLFGGWGHHGWGGPPGPGGMGGGFGDWGMPGPGW